MIRLPHVLVHAPRVTRLTGHDAVTVLVWTFTARPTITARLVRHERRHVHQWLIGTLVGAVVIVALPVSLLWLPLAPLGFLLPYLACHLAVGYTRNPFERDAERYAERER